MKRVIFPVALILSTPLRAQEPTTTEPSSIDMSKAEDNPLGWKWAAKTVAGFNVVDKKNVVGQSDGKTHIYSLKLGAGITRVTEQSEWENEVNADEVFTRTPVLDRLVKSSDELMLLSFYKYFFSPGSSFGSYARGAIVTNLLDTYDEREDFATYSVANRDGSTETKTAERYKTATALSPMTTKESVGLIMRVVTNPLSTIELRSGLAAKQFYAQGSYQVTDDDDPKNIVLVEISDTRVAGIEVAAEVAGALPEKTLVYKAYLEALYPFSYSPKDDSDPEKTKLVATEAGFDVTLKLVDWMGVSYSAKSKRDPLLQPEAQTSHNLLATITVSTGS